MRLRVTRDNGEQVESWCAMLARAETGTVEAVVAFRRIDGGQVVTEDDVHAALDLYQLATDRQIQDLFEDAVCGRNSTGAISTSRAGS